MRLLLLLFHFFYKHNHHIIYHIPVIHIINSDILALFYQPSLALHMIRHLRRDAIRRDIEISIDESIYHINNYLSPVLE